MPAPDPAAPTMPSPPNPGVTVDTFSGLKNTVSPERLTARELSRARNVDIDDLGQAHRRRGRRLVAPGRWHSVFTTTTGVTFGICNGILVLVFRDYSTVAIMPGISDAPLSWVEVGPVLYATSIHNSFQIDLPSLIPRPWGRVVGHSYQPGLEPAVADFWFSPVVRPDTTQVSALGPVAGRLFGPPPLGAHAAWLNGRIHIAAGSVLWTTELYLYNYVDKTKGFRQYEAEITGLCAVEDGLYVGTTQALYFVSGRYGEETRLIKERSGVVPGSMVNVPGELIDPEGRRFPDLPRSTSKAMACMTADGVVCGLGGGGTYNLTRNQFVFPEALRAATLFRQEDGINSLVMPLKSGGTPAENARFGDYIEATLIRAGSPGQPG